VSRRASLLPRSRLAPLSVPLWLVIVALPAHAYRPFDSTDASVVEPGTVEIELGPVGYLREASENSLIVPALVVNVGLLERLEFVAEGKGVIALGADPEDLDDFELDGVAVLLKGIVRRGSLQGRTGPSLAIEPGVQIPTQERHERVGASLLAIASQSWDSLSLHLNLGSELTPEHDTVLLAGLIAEGPGAWRVRPVAELRAERALDEHETLASGLVGAIWCVSDRLSLDAALRAGRLDGSALFEIRAGVTWEFAL